MKVNSLEEFVRLAKGGKITYASGGNGNPGHLAMEQLASLIDAKMTHVPYRGTPPAVNDLIAGQVDTGFLVTPGIVQQVRAGKLKALMISGKRRSRTCRMSRPPPNWACPMPRSSSRLSFSHRLERRTPSCGG